MPVSVRTAVPTAPEQAETRMQKITIRRIQKYFKVYPFGYE
jgi:hypothetical protein